MNIRRMASTPRRLGRRLLPAVVGSQGFFATLAWKFLQRRRTIANTALGLLFVMFVLLAFCCSTLEEANVRGKRTKSGFSACFVCLTSTKRFVSPYLGCLARAFADYRPTAGSCRPVAGNMSFIWTLWTGTQALLVCCIICSYRTSI